MATNETWDEAVDRMATQLDAGPEEAAVYAAKVALTGLLDRDGVACPAAAVVKALADLVEERAQAGNDPIANAAMALDLRTLLEKRRPTIT